MPMEQRLMVLSLVGLLMIAVVSDLRRHRIPNWLVLLGLVLGLASQAYFAGITGLGNGLLGLLVGFVVFLPLYVLGGMAAGDVKLMAMVGSFLAPGAVLWAAGCSLLAGGLCGFLLVLVRGQLPLTLSRYWLMLRAQAYLAPAPNEVADQPFPYSVAILLGTLLSLFWQPFKNWQLFGFGL
ncbi:prepilin peptidase [Pseudomonas sp. LS44]|uniref:A24 family peptidase n=1 Tax=Pseudomonas sp. LS44 TaxID=1357074 RepID=UPI00215A582E|nr:prepilin peptidase [Pseudomonas sp. LS44]UVE17096.1 prepilin peptidase [Pseudomonas sp. LS44]